MSLKPGFISSLKLEASEETKDLTPEEQLADKLRLQKLQEEADLELAKETFGEHDDTELWICCAGVVDANVQAAVFKEVGVWNNI